eukprot:1442661-Rhodomonas_salina.2
MTHTPKSKTRNRIFIHSTSIFARASRLLPICYPPPKSSTSCPPVSTPFPPPSKEFRGCELLCSETQKPQPRFHDAVAEFHDAVVELHDAAAEFQGGGTEASSKRRRRWARLAML